MYKKTIKYTDFNDVDRSEDFYFNLTKAELMELNFKYDGGLSAYITRITNTQDTKALAELFKELVLCTYGEKSDDGKRFMKNPELSANFACTQAYSEFYMLLSTNEKEATKFINGILPKDIVAEVEKQKNSGNIAPLNQ